MKNKINSIIILGGCGFLFIVGIIILMSLFLLSDFDLLLTILYILLGIGICCFLYGWIVCIIHVFHNDYLSGLKKFGNILLLILLNIFYIPIYYTKYIVGIRVIYGVVNSLLYVGIVVLGIYFVFDFKILKEGETSLYKSNDDIISLNINKTWICTTENVAGNNLYCYKKYAKDSLGIFNYTDRHDTDVLVKFHVEQSINILKEQGYKFLKSNIDSKYGFTKAILTKDNKRIYAITAVRFEEEDYITIVNYYGFSVKEFLEIFDNISSVSA